MSARVSALLAALVAIPGLTAYAAVPPGYRLIQVTQNDKFELDTKINNSGSTVFARRLGSFFEEETEEIFLYKDGLLTQVTDDRNHPRRDTEPDINHAGTMVWSRAIGPEGRYGRTFEIVIYRDGKLTRLTDNDVEDYGPRINNLGHLVWAQWDGEGCRKSSATLMFYDGNEVRALTDDLYSNQPSDINDLDQIVYTRFDFCPWPDWDSDVLMWDDGVITQLDSPEEFDPQVPAINNLGEVAWQTRNRETGVNSIRLWRDGLITVFTDWGWNPRINDFGDIFFLRWHDDMQLWQAWAYLDGQIYQLSEDWFSNYDGDINNAGQIVWASGDVPWTDIRLLTPDSRKKHQQGGNGTRIDPIGVDSYVPVP